MAPTEGRVARLERRWGNASDQKLEVFPRVLLHFNLCILLCIGSYSRRALLIHPVVDRLLMLTSLQLQGRMFVAAAFDNNFVVSLRYSRLRRCLLGRYIDKGYD